jgi:hypothetical protein
LITEKIDDQKEALINLQEELKGSFQNESILTAVHGG